MVKQFSGAVFQGEMEQDGFYLKQVKNIATASFLSTTQIKKLAAYLDAQGDSCTITVNDQLPILLTETEMMHLQQDIAGILKSTNE